MYDQLRAYILNRTKGNSPHVDRILACFSPLSARRGQHLVEPGQVCKHYYFVNTGCLRLYALSADGKEATRYFAFEGAFGTALPSLINQRPAFEYLQAIEPSELLAIERTDFFALVETLPEMAHIYRLILEAAFITAQHRIYGFQQQSALEKLQWLLGYQPTILSRLSNKMVASFLGVTPSTLSRLKASL